MLFKGRLRLPNDPGEGIPIDLVLEDVFLSLESGGEDFGEWRLDTVEIKRLFSNQFAMLLDGEEMVFVADDALGFAYDGLTTIDDVKSRLSKKRIFKGRKPKKRVDPSGPEPAPDVVDPEETTPKEVVSDVPMPEVVPFFPESSPSFAESVAESAVVDDSIAPVAPRRIEVADTSSEQPPPASSPAVQPPTPATPEPAPVAERPAASLENADAVEAQTVAQPVPSNPYEDDDDELVIEDVSAYGYVPVASAPIDQQPMAVEPESFDDEIEIEEAAPATGAGPREVHPLGEAAPARAAEVHPLGVPVEPEQPVSFEPESIADMPSVAPEPPPPASAPPVAEPIPAPPTGDSSFFAQWSSNGHAEPEPEPELELELELEPETPDKPQTQKGGRHARGAAKSRSSLFGRKKSREPEEHEHRYESSKTVGGITRSVCAICGHVSFAGEDVYQDW